ncbi:uncharacterized protein LOC119397976 [Rhipicephalus sanguineus]|uniref:uncharacterized protein LOC119397976 n=1 Tax=Rhipicephalus sanguineus TaxID=34632 RepID=UPI001895E7AC|nr:uncharacterized protein LOC119397976 [Rhipicephalus sanguineus]
MEQTDGTSSRDQNLPEQRGEPSCSAIAVRLPQYWDQHPSAWFLQAESQFQVAGIRSQATKFHYAVAALSPTAIDEVADLLSNPLSANAYDDLKTTLLQRTAVSQRARIQQLLSAEELGDRRPSQLLRRMKQLLGDNARSVDDALLRELFLQRLPANVQMVLATASTMDLTGLAALADKVMEVATPAIAATTPSTGESTTTLRTLQSSSTAQSPLDALCERLERIVSAAEHRRASPHRSRHRSSSKPRRTPTSRDASPTPGICYYHRRFGNDARHCRRPCAWQGNRPADL